MHVLTAALSCYSHSPPEGKTMTAAPSHFDPHLQKHSIINKGQEIELSHLAPNKITNAFKNNRRNTFKHENEANVARFQNNSQQILMAKQRQKQSQAYRMWLSTSHNQLSD